MQIDMFFTLFVVYNEKQVDGASDEWLEGGIDLSLSLSLGLCISCEFGFLCVCAFQLVFILGLSKSLYIV